MKDMELGERMSRKGGVAIERQVQNKHRRQHGPSVT